MRCRSGPPSRSRGGRGRSTDDSGQVGSYLVLGPRSAGHLLAPPRPSGTRSELWGLHGTRLPPPPRRAPSRSSRTASRSDPGPGTSRALRTMLLSEWRDEWGPPRLGPLWSGPRSLRTQLPGFSRFPRAAWPSVLFLFTAGSGRTHASLTKPRGRGAAGSLPLGTHGSPRARSPVCFVAGAGWPREGFSGSLIL